MMEMKYPSLEQFVKSNFDFSEDNQVDQSFSLIASCVDKKYSLRMRHGHLKTFTTKKLMIS